MDKKQSIKTYGVAVVGKYRFRGEPMILTMFQFNPAQYVLFNDGVGEDHSNRWSDTIFGETVTPEEIIEACFFMEVQTIYDGYGNVVYPKPLDKGLEGMYNEFHFSKETNLW
ncbi:MAG: hypothetical protein GWN01_12135 [Nitrosopumilaceae archaeon]|nr:hypothetical protein [Nitrosopumilaceae archaeon]NIU88043.1 hypothetical protein [Nitrosopumilaceae archaeon]NIX62227.1 hypothetical protein [Nitrosopumilaceae archaeon]